MIEQGVPFSHGLCRRTVFYFKDLFGCKLPGLYTAGTTFLTEPVSLGKVVRKESGKESENAMGEGRF